MHKKYLPALAVLAATFFLAFAAPSRTFAAEPQTVPVKGMATLVDLGARSCIPCKMMAPILDKMEKRYKGKAAVIFLDVREDPAPAYHFRIRGIPTQIFFDKEGNEVYRHMGYMSEEEIVAQFRKMGVK